MGVHRGFLLAIALMAVGALLHGEARGAPPASGDAAAAVTAACDAAQAIAAKVPGVAITRSAGRFSDEALAAPVPGCRVAITGSFARAPEGGDAANRLREAFAARGWREMVSYGADGKDGTAFALRKGPVACLFRGSWNGGADGEPPISPEDAYRVSVICTSPVIPEERAR